MQFCCANILCVRVCLHPLALRTFLMLFGILVDGITVCCDVCQHVLMCVHLLKGKGKKESYPVLFYSILVHWCSCIIRHANCANVCAVSCGAATAGIYPTPSARR